MQHLAIFDLDDTLCDYALAFSKAQRRINLVLRDAGIIPDKFWKLYRSIEPSLHTSMIAGFISCNEYRWRRFADVCAYFTSSVGVLPDILGQIFNDETVKKIDLFDDSLLTLRQLKNAGWQIVILCNGDVEAMREKYRKFDLSSYILSKHLFISEEIGFVKPEREAFRRVLVETNTKAENAIMISSSYENDIEGAKLLGIRGIWLKRNSERIFSSDIEIIYSLTDLLDILNIRHLEFDNSDSIIHFMKKERESLSEYLINH